MRGMEEVGRLFNDNQLIVAEVLQSAEAMKTAVGHLEQFMARDESATRGTIVLATVKGDVHDIGKNLVEIILKNNGYRVINLGIKVPPEELIAAYHAHKPDAIGLSGLLVKSAQQMVVTAQDLRAAGVEIPLFVGGAALTRKFTATRIAAEYPGPTLYAKDAMDGLDLANRLFNATTREALLADLRERAGGAPGAAARRGPPPGPAGAPGGAFRGLADGADPGAARPRPHVLRYVPLSHVFPYLNLQMLLGKHLGLKGAVTRLLDDGRRQGARDPRAGRGAEREAAAQRLPAGRRPLPLLRGAARPATTSCSTTGGREVARASLPAPARRRAPVPRRLRARRRRRESADYVALFAVTCGAGVRELAERWKDEGQYLRSHMLQALAIESAEAFAEMLHARLRTQWGFPDPPGTTLSDRLKAHYRGLRVSFGYPACPNLADQRILFDLLQPGADRPRPDRGLHDGPGGLGVGRRVPSSRGEVLQGRRRRLSRRRWASR